MIAKRAIVVASGASIREGQWDIPPNNLPVWCAINNELTIGINWCFKYFSPTVNLHGDYEFYISEKENLRKLPLVFGMQDSYYGRSLEIDWKKRFHLENNIYLLPNRIERENEIFYHGVNAWKYGFYSRYLSGILGINLAVAFGCTEIYLLGFDGNTTDGRTHFYQDEFTPSHQSESGKEICGVGIDENGKYKTSNYNQDFNEEFLPFKKELNRIQILNVSKNSGITVFPKITYSEFYDRLLEGKLQQSQDELRDRILEKYNERYHA